MDKFEDIQRLREEFDASMDEADAKRSAYYREIKKLNLAGVPLREIAEALGLSHQRVHQIVTGEPMSPPRKRWAKGGAAVLVILLVSAGSVAGFLLHRTPAPIPSASNVVDVPNVVGLTVPEAQHILEANGVCVRAIQASGDGVPRPIVSGQSLPPGTPVDRLTPVNIRVQGPARVGIYVGPTTQLKGAFSIFQYSHELPGIPMPSSGEAPYLLVDKPSTACGATLNLFGVQTLFGSHNYSVSFTNS